MTENKTLTIDAAEKNLPQAQAFVEKVLRKRRVNASIASEIMVLFGALFREIISQAGEKSTELEIGSAVELGHTDIKITFSGKRFSLHKGDVSSDPDAKVIESYSEKISCSYQGGCNVIRVSVSQSAWAFVLPNFIAVVAALVVGTVLEFTLDDPGRQLITQEWITPLEKLFTNAVLMIGAPMTLFSLLKNVTDSCIVAERHSSSRRLFVNSMASSLVAVAVALVMGFMVAQSILAASGVTERFDIGFANWSLASAVDQIIPSSIIEPFETISPIPMIFVVLLVAGALNSIGQSFSILKRAIDACYDLFSGILRIVMAFFPLACFLLFLEVLLAKDGVLQFMDILYIAAVVFVCTLPLLAVYAFRLRAHGITVREFARKLWPLVKENFVIGSVIDAVPYNTRYCVKNFSISRKRLEKELPVLAQTSLDGNCFILMLLATIYIFVANCEVSWLNVAVVALIVMFLSFGAPNQPGSILIGMLVVLTYLNSDAVISLALCFELFCGGLQNILNVISSVVTVAENECRESGSLSKAS
ncbi:MAG: cation:dicarboxylase symporter family transporter [Eggerthellaceae bacterium]|nr:cation:dicarboxylase symporter family transporter [Eggerthellaceae bacterium]